MTHYPVVLFVFNRLSHTQATLDALKNNHGALSTDLIVYADGPRSQAETNSCNAVRDYLKTFSETGGFQSFRIVERETNYGLARSIIEGVSEVLQSFQACIVLEDDIVTSPFFLNYMNTALETYEQQKQVWHISGYNFPIETQGLPETFFFRGASCWSWATWRDRWEHFEKNPEKLIQNFSGKEIYRFDYNGAGNNWFQVLKNKSGRINTWAVFWYATVFAHDGLCLHPAKALAVNIGHDGSGEHCQTNSAYSASLPAHHRIPEMNSEIVENPEAVKRITDFLWRSRPLFKSVLKKGHALMIRLLY